jgi:TolA-binding protein
VRALRELTQRMEQRVEQLEAQESLRSARGTAPAGAKAPSTTSEVPDLTVVKLKPKTEPAPRLDLTVPVMEPAQELVEALADPPATGGSGGGRADPEALDAQFNAGLEALRTGNVEGGTQRLVVFARENPRHPKADNALYFAGLGRIGLDEHAAAAQLFEQLVDTYPAGDAVVEAMLKLAECRVRLNRSREARTLYGEIISRYPGTTAASQAEARLSALSP